MRAVALFLIGLGCGCASPTLPAQRPADFSVAYHRSSMTAPAVVDSWRLNAAGWTFGAGSDQAIAGPAEPNELDSAYQLVREARLDRMESKASGGKRTDGHSETVTLTVSGKEKILTTGTHYELVTGDSASHRRAVDGLGKLAGAALLRLTPP